MTIAFWCVLIAAFIPLACSLTAKMSGSGFPPANNHNPREFLESLSGSRKRAHWAQQNTFEAFPPFAAAVIIAHIAHGSQQWVDGLAMAFVVLRVLYAVFYITDKASARSAAWGAALACMIGLFIVAARASV
jgi:uncharacterized MAPEG superfamily protein